MSAMIVLICIAAFVCAANAGGYPVAPIAAAPVAAPVYSVASPYTYSGYRVYTNNFKGSPYVAAAPVAAAVPAYPAAAPVATAFAASVASAAVAAPVAAAAVPAAPLTYAYTSYAGGYAGYGYPYYGAYIRYLKK